MMCDEPAQFVIKSSNDFYCESCAIECFSDTSLLQRVEEQAKELKELIKEEVQERLQEAEKIEASEGSPESSQGTRDADASNKSRDSSTEED